MSNSIIKQEINDELMLYQTGREMVHVLNPTARLIYDLYQQGYNTDQITESMEQTFDIQCTQDLKNDISECIAQLKENQVIL